MERRTFLGLLAVGAATVAAGGSGVLPRAAVAAPRVPSGSSGEGLPRPFSLAAQSGPPTPETSDPTIPPPVDDGIPEYGPPVYEPPEVVFGPTLPMNQLALTIDDGLDADVVAAYVALAQDTGIHITFSPNGVYADDWSRHAPVLRPLIEAGQVQIANHTYSHLDLTQLGEAEIQRECERNEAWVNATFGTSTRPYLRPPFGFHNSRVREAVAESGFHQVLMWNGSLGDAVVLTPEVLLTQAQLYVKAGTVLLGHANHPTVTHCYDQILELVQARELTMVTLDEMFATSRPPRVGTVAPTTSPTTSPTVS